LFAMQVPVIDLTQPEAQVGAPSELSRYARAGHEEQVLLQAELIGDTVQVAQEVRQACEQVGFFYLGGHGVADSLIQQVRQAAGGG
jgi:hypothetical protein